MKKRHTPEQIVAMLRQADVDLGKGQKVPEICKQLGISEQTYYRWRQKYGGMGPIDGQADEGDGAGERPSQAAGRRPGVGYPDPQGSRPPKLIDPERRRRTVDSVRRRLGHDKISERRACKALGQPRSTQRYCPKKPDADRRLIAEMRRLVASFPRYGSDRVHQLLVQANWRVNFKRVHRLWKQEHMQVPRKQHKRRRLTGNSANACVRHRATHRNHVWSYDFVTDRTEDGRQLKLLVVIDEFTRECLAVEAARTFISRDVKLTLQYLFAVRGAPEHIRSDNGPEFVAKEIQRWLGQAQVRTLYIRKASPWENGYVESFNGRLRDELLNRELFLGLDEARYVLDQWREQYNCRRPHSGIGWQTPAAYAAGLNDEDAGGVFPSAQQGDPPVGATPLPPAHPAQTTPILSL